MHPLLFIILLLLLIINFYLNLCPLGLTVINLFYSILF